MKLKQALKASGVAILMALTAVTVSAQDNPPGQPGQGRRNGGQGGPGGNFDPAQFQQRMMERTKEQLEITDDNEWKAIEPLVQKVMDARRETLGGLGRGFGRGGRGGGNGGNNGNNNGGRGGFGGTPDPAAEALQKAIDAKAPNAEIKSALAKYVASRKEKQAELDKAQAALRKVLTPRQEAIAALNGLL
jgi:Spy/CpxP family protein refolding chaperone